MNPDPPVTCCLHCECGSDPDCEICPAPTADRDALIRLLWDDETTFAEAADKADALLARFEMRRKA